MNSLNFAAFTAAQNNSEKSKVGTPNTTSTIDVKSSNDEQLEDNMDISRRGRRSNILLPPIFIPLYSNSAIIFIPEFIKGIP